MKAYVIDTVSADFYRAVGRYVDAGTRELIGQVRSTGESTAVLHERLKAALADDPRLASRLALWARRLLGEVLTHAQRVSLEHAFLAGLSGLDDAGARELVRGLTAELAANHARRMAGLGLTG
jgi:hypothetical protein